jgi:hypothetical protein
MTKSLRLCLFYFFLVFGACGLGMYLVSHGNLIGGWGWILVGALLDNKLQKT